jgi:hypothetical protein
VEERDQKRSNQIGTVDEEEPKSVSAWSHADSDSWEMREYLYENIPRCPHAPVDG